jgi:hypothetical protein
MAHLTQQQEQVLHHFLAALIDQERARVLVPPYQAAPGFWFGGGNPVVDDQGDIWLCGRYRNAGDARTGLAAGERGLECALFRSDDHGQHFYKVASWSKADLAYGGRAVLSIEGTALHRLADGMWELFISSEKEIDYPEAVRAYQKPGTGVWSIDRMTGPSLLHFDLGTLAPAIEHEEMPDFLHVKDPVVFDRPAGVTALIFCSHPFSWSSSNSGLALRRLRAQRFHLQSWEIVARGPAWDVAATRITAHLSVPALGAFAGQPPASLYFYDGAECLRPHDENPLAHHRPRGYSCEELGGVFFGWDAGFPQIERLSRLRPLFVSPWGTGCSRYVHTLSMDEGIFAAWQQGQADGSQPLVGHFLPMDEMTRLLSG